MEKGVNHKMNKIILVISVCKEKLHELEFVRPIEFILNSENKKFETKHYLEILDGENFNSYSHVIVCGTSLKDFSYLERLDKFSWIKDFGGSLLGICAGMQIIGLVNGCKLENYLQIGLSLEYFNKTFLGLESFGEKNSLEGEQIQIYSLHNKYIDFNNLDNFEVYCATKCKIPIPQAVKHKEKEIYGVLFHPEVRNKELIINFINL